MFLSILTLEYSLNLGSFCLLFGVRVGFKNCFGVSLYRLISFVISVWLYKSYIASELKSKVLRWTDGRTNGRPAGRVRENNATSGPNSSAEAEMNCVELVRWGRVWQQHMIMIHPAQNMAIYLHRIAKKVQYSSLHKPMAFHSSQTAIHKYR